MQPCHRWAPEFNKTALNFGIAISGEWSLAVNDCGRCVLWPSPLFLPLRRGRVLRCPRRLLHSFLNNVFQGTRLEGTYPNASQPMYPPSAPLGTCEFWEVRRTVPSPNTLLPYDSSSVRFEEELMSRPMYRTTRPGPMISRQVCRTWRWLRWTLFKLVSCPFSSLASV